MARLSSGEGLNLGVRPPATFLGWPVRGFLPLRAFRPVPGGLGPAARGRHRRHEIRASHERDNAMAIRSGRMLAEALWAVKRGPGTCGPGARGPGTCRRVVVSLGRREEGAAVHH